MPIPLDVDATWLNPGAITLDAGELRRADAALLAGADGVAFGGVARHSDTSLAVTLSGDTVTVQPGSAVIPGNAVSQSGAYRVSVSAAQTQALAARHSTNPRITRVVLRALDTDVVPAHGAYKGRLEFIDYAPAATPGSTVTALPAMAVELGRITVPQTGGGAAILDSTWRTYACAAGGELIVPTSARLPATNVPKGQVARLLDAPQAQYVWNGTSWQRTGPAAGSVFLASHVDTVDIAFPTGRFTSAPIVHTTAVPGTNNVGLSVMAGNITATGFRAYIYGIGGTWSTGNASLLWSAVEAGS